MPDELLHDVGAADEGLHAAGPEALWNESVYLDLVSGDGSLGAYARIGLTPNQGVAWWTGAVVGPGRPTVSSVVHDVRCPPVAGRVGPGSVALEADRLRLRYGVDEALGQVTLRGRAPGRTLDHPADAFAVPGRGRPSEVALDLTWRTDGTPYHYGVTTRYEVPCVVEGTLAVDGVVVPVSGTGQRDHSWGVRDWWALGWCWTAFRLEDGTRAHVADIRLPEHRLAFGYVQEATPGGWACVPVATADVSEDFDVDDLPTAARVALEPSGLVCELEPVGHGPVLLVSTDGRTSRFPRALVRVTAADGRTGSGWVEWNRPQGGGSGPTQH